MASATTDLQMNYTRDDAPGPTTPGAGEDALASNRLALFWRPIIDLVHSDYAPMRLQFVRPVAAWLADPAAARWPEFAMIGVSGLRHQVVRHANLPRYTCEDPTDLPADLRTEQWQTLVDHIERFDRLDYKRKTLTLFHLAQLSLCRFAIRLAGQVEVTGDHEHDSYAYMAGRIYSRYPGGFRVSLPLFERMAHETPDAVLGVQACFQGIGHGLRNKKDVQFAIDLETRGRARCERLPDTRRGALARSRFHRSVALLRLRQGDPEGMAREIEDAHAFGQIALERSDDDIERGVALENRRIIVESQIKAADRSEAYRDLVDLGALCETLLGIDPYCQYTRIVLGEGYTAHGDLASAAHWYRLAGEQGTAGGALSWFRAAQCYELLGDRWSALNAMARCLELDPDVVEARDFVARATGRP